MITEDYVSFETAKLLIDKGFDWKCEYCYDVANDNPYSNANYQVSCPKPTLQMAMKWLREEHNLFVFPFPQMNTNKFWAEIYQLSDSQEWENLYCETIDLEDYSSYEQACEAAIKYCLENLI